MSNERESGMSDETVTLTIAQVRRLIEIADRAGVKQGLDIVGPHDTVVVELVRQKLEKAVA